MTQLLDRIALRACVLTLGFAALAIPTVVAAPAALAADSGCVVTSQPLGAATGYTEFIAGNGSRGSESEGAIAWGGNLSANGMTVGTRLSSAASAATLVVAGTHGTFNLQKGSAYLNPKSGVNFNGGGSYLASNPINFSDAFTTLTARSTAWGNAASNAIEQHGQVAGQNYLILKGTDPTLNIFNLNPAHLASGAGIAYDVPAGSNVLVNVSGTTVNLQGQMWIKKNGNYDQASDSSMAAWPGILWNFPEATSITMNFGSAWGGSILAPKANLTVNSVGHTIGQVITAQFSSSYETHQNLFPSSACLPPTSTTPPAPVTHPSIQLTKTASAVADLDGNGTDAGDQITYGFKVTNSGDVALDQLTLNDPLLGGAVTCPSAALAAGASTTCTSRTYTITAADMNAGSRLNSATITGRAPDATVVSADGSVSTPLIATMANLRIAKSVSASNPRSGQSVAYTITATNDGPAAAANVVVNDALPAGITYVSSTSPCTFASGSVTCALGSLAAGASRSVQVVATVDAVPTGDAAAQHDLDVQKYETDAPLEPGQTRTVAVDCAPGYLVLDGSSRVDAVDQGTGTLADVHLLESYASDADTWTVTLRNDATGRAQTKAFAVCVQATTSALNGHSHPLLVTGPSAQGVPVGSNGQAQAALSCATGEVPVAPGFRFASAATALTSRPAGATGWSFAAEGLAPGTATFSVRCLATKTGSAAGHQHDLSLTQLTRSVPVPAGQKVEEQLSCEGDAKGVVAGARLGTGLVGLGNDPRPKTRAFSLLNPTAAPVQADLWLLCLSTKTVGANASASSVVNTATGSTSTPETSYADNSGSAAFTVDTSPAPVASPVSTSVKLAGSTVATSVSCSSGTTDCTGTATLVALKTQKVAGRTVRKGAVLATATYRVRAGKQSVVKLKPTALGTKVLKAKGLKKATLKVGKKSRTVTVRH